MLPQPFVRGLIAATLTAFATCAAAQGLSIVDDRGATVTVPDAVERLASVSYFGADVALAVGKSVAASTYMVEGRSPEFLGDGLQGVTWIGQRATPNLELLAQAKPDLTVAIRRYTEGAAAQIEKIAPYLAYDLELFSDSDRKIRELGALLGKGDKAMALNAQFADDLKAFAEKAPKDVHPRFAVMWGGEVPWVFRNENMTAAILIGLGGHNIAGANPSPSDPSNWGVELSLEEILEKDPEVLFIYDYGPDRPHEGNPVWQHLSAVKSGRVHYVGDHWVEAHGPIARQMVLREAAHFLYPETFPAVDVKAEANRMIAAGKQ